MKGKLFLFSQYLRGLSVAKKVTATLLLLALLVFWLSLPAVLFKAPTSFVISDKENNLLNASIAEDGQWRFPYNAQVPDKFVKCITAFEDKRFFYHPGVDPVALVRAIKQNITKSKTVSGGSTITMQVVRLYKQNNRRNLFNKFKGIFKVRMSCVRLNAKAINNP